MNNSKIKNLIVKALFIGVLTLFFVINFYKTLIVTIILLFYLALTKIIDGEGDK